MQARMGSWIRLGLVVVVAALGTWSVTFAQQFLSTLGAPPLPALPPTGAWGEVIMADSKWMVVQNHQGQQFPIKMDSSHIRQFLVRWPISPNTLTELWLVEAIGMDLGSNILQTDHVDVFEPADQDLVQRTYTSLLTNNQVVTTIDPSFNRFMNAWDIGAQATMHGWAYPVGPGQLGIPTRLHVVGNVNTIAPELRLRILGNNFVTVVPPVPSDGLKMHQVTHGTASFVQKGDLAFLTPVEVNSDSLTLAQLVLYKKVPRNRFEP